MAKSVKDVFKSIMAAMREPDESKRAELIKAAEADANATPDAPVPAAPQHDDSHLKSLQNLHKDMGEKIKAFGEGPHAADHPVHAMKALHENMGKMLKEAGCDMPSDEPGGLAHPAVAKAIAEVEKRNVELTKRLDDERNLRLDGEMTQILKSFKATPFQMEGADSDVTKFRKMKESDPAMYERTMTILKATDAQLAMSKSFANIGSSLTGTGSAWDQIEAKAEKLMEKASGKDLTKEQAIEKVLMAEPKLAEQYRAEQN